MSLSDWLQVTVLIATFGVVVVTGVLAFSTEKMARSTAAMAEESKTQRLEGARPYVAFRDLTGSAAWAPGHDGPHTVEPKAHGFFITMNNVAGGPALDLH